MQLTDVLIHININEGEKESLVERLRDLEGGIALRFNKDKKPLLLVAYNSDTINALTLSHEIKNKVIKLSF